MHAFDVVGDLVRRRILKLLADGESAGAFGRVIQAEFGISQPAVSAQVRSCATPASPPVRAEGRGGCNAVNAEPLRSVDVWFERFRRLCPASRRAGNRGRA